MRVRPTPAQFDRSGARRRRSAAAIVVVAAAGLVGAPAASAVAPTIGLGASYSVAPASPSVPSGLAANLRTSKATVKKTSCASLTRKAKKAKGSERRRLNTQVTRCKRGNEAAARALEAIADGRYVGTRGDGQTVDWIFCANGKYTTRTTDRSGTGISNGSNWRIGAAQPNGSKGFTAIVEDPKESSSVGFSLSGGTWGVGVSRSDDSVESIGTVQRTDATAECAAL